MILLLYYTIATSFTAVATATTMILLLYYTISTYFTAAAAAATTTTTTTTVHVDNRLFSSWLHLALRGNATQRGSQRGLPARPGVQNPG